MKSYILTELERQLLRDFLAEDVKKEGFKMLLHRMRKNVSQLKADLELVSEVLKKVES